MTGQIEGGQQPVTGASIQLYAVGTTADGSASTALLNTAVKSDGGGSFSITGDYTCGSPTQEVYLVVTGGNPGLSAGTNNASLAMMAGLGQCGSLTSSTFVLVDEVTTVGSVAALYPYMTSYAAIGSGSSDAAALVAAFGGVDEFTNIATGTAPGPTLPAGYYASSLEINALGDILASCINSSGGVAGDGSPCGNLFTLTTPAGGNAPTDTIGALINILNNPAQNVTAIFGLGGASAPFQPTLSSAPSNWTLPIIPIPASPTFSPAAGTYSGTQSVTINESTLGATVYYTTNGATPTATSTLYTGPITVAASETIKAIANEGGRVNSAANSAAYVITVPAPAATPTFSPAAGTYASTQTVTITSTTPGASIYYTTNGSTPTSSSTLYTGSITVSNSEIISAIALSGGFTSSPVASATYILNIQASPASAPTFSPVAGSYSSTQTVTLNSTTPGTTIYYTTDTSTPTTSSNVYTTAGISASSSVTIKAIATATGYTTSSTVSAGYLINQGIGIITTIAGNGTAGGSGDGGVATSAQLNTPMGSTAADSSGNVYIADLYNSSIRKVTPSGIISTYVTGFQDPNSVALDGSGNLYTTDGYTLFKVTPAGIVSRIAGGGGSPSSIGDGGPATSAYLNYVQGIAVDNNGNIYLADSNNHRVRKITPAGIISTVAGTGNAGYSGDGGTATSATLYYPSGVAVDAAGNIYIADTRNQRVRKVTLTGTILAVAGTGNPGYGGDGGPATNASLNNPTGVVVDGADNVYIADQFNHRVRKVIADGTISTVVGTGVVGFTGDGGPATSAEVYDPEGVALDGAGNLYITDYPTQRVRKVTFGHGLQVVAPTFSLAAGTYSSIQSVGINTSTPGASIYYTTDGTTPTISSTLYTGPLTISTAETFNAIAVAAGYANSAVASAAYVVGTQPFASAPTFGLAPGTFTATQSVTLSTTTSNASIYYTIDGSIPTTASTLYGGAVSVPSSETINAIAVATGYTNSTVASAGYYINPGIGIITTVAGNGSTGYSGDGGQATVAALNNPYGVTVDTSGNLYIADTQNCLIRKVTPTGVITTVAGNRFCGYSGDGGPATSAQINGPTGLAVDSVGNLYFADPVDHYIRKVTPAGIISTLAGNGTASYSGDGGAAINAGLWSPAGVAVDSTGNVYIADTNNLRIRKVAPTGIISTFAGNGTLGFTGDGGAAINAELWSPAGVAVDSTGNVYIADTNNHRIRKVTPVGIISTLAGSGSYGYSGDGGAATSASLSSPQGISVDSAGNLYIADAQNYRIRKVTPAGIILTAAGNGTIGFTGDGGAAPSAEFDGPWSVATDSSGNIYIADYASQRIRKVTFGVTLVTAAPVFSLQAGTYPGAQSVSITDTTPGAVIYYTTNGSTPTTSSTVYNGAPISVTLTETVKTIAVAPQYASSNVVSALYNII